MLQPKHKLQIVKVTHTFVWALFVVAIIAIPILAVLQRWILVAALVGLVLVECLVLLINRWRCPLTDIAARYTDDRRANFDIYLPHALAEHNKSIFGTLFAVGLVFSLLWWWVGG